MTLKLPSNISLPQIQTKILSSFPQLQSRLSGLIKKKSAEPEVSVPRLVCDFGRSKLIFVEVEKQADGIHLTKLNKIPRPAEAAKDAEILKQSFEAGGYASKKVRISVKGQGVIIRFIQFPLMKLADLRGAISFEIDQYIPFKAHEVIWDIHVLDEAVPLSSGTGMNILLVAVKREDLYQTIQLFQSAGLEIELIDVDALAVINALEFFQPEQFTASSAILDIGTEISTLSVLQAGKPRFIRDISFGGVDVIKRLKRKLGLNQEQAIKEMEVDKVPTPETSAVIQESFGDLVSDLKLSLNYYLDQVAGAEPVKNLFIAGGGGYYPLVLETLRKDFAISVDMMDIVSKIRIGSGVDAETVKKNSGLLGVAMGLALRDL